MFWLCLDTKKSPSIAFYLSFVGTKSFLEGSQFATSILGCGGKEKKGEMAQYSDSGVLQHRIFLSHKLLSQECGLKFQCM